MEKNKIKRLLCIVGSMNAGGAETFLMKIYRSLDKNKYQMDFYVSTQDKGVYDDEIISMGGKIYRSVPKSRNPLKSFISITKLVREENYEYVMRVSQHSLSTIDLIAAKLGGAKKLIYRSSNSRTVGSYKNQILHNIFKIMSIYIPDVKIAPSTEAAEFMFGKRCIDKKRANIIKNALPIEVFEFNEDKRKKIRLEFDIEDMLVIGHVGRFNKQKNHMYLIEVFNEIYKKNKNSVLLLVGKGDLEFEIKNRIAQLGLEKNVIFTGIRSDVASIMMAMDIFIFPSFFEGMPNTVIEAQATGLQCLVSDKITKESNITGNVKYLSIETSPKVWASEALQLNPLNRKDGIIQVFNDQGYDIDSVTSEFINKVFRR